MNYRHIYHAGNFADGFKHVLLLQLVAAMQQKPKGFCYLDTHAGTGLYDLSQPEAERSQEYRSGVSRLVGSHHQALSHYQSVLQAFPAGYYPGSPLMVQSQLRSQDRMVVNEKHPEDFQALKRNLYALPNVACHQRDAYEFLPAMLPVKERRVLILIDPPYEQRDEYQRITDTVQKSLALMPQAVLVVWYPIKAFQHQQWLHQMTSVIQATALSVELTLSDRLDGASGLVGCGMFIVNPPWQIEQQLELCAQALWQEFAIEKNGGVLLRAF